MQVHGIGELKDRGAYWLLIYEGCRHAQQFARVGLDTQQRAMREVERYYADCLTCQLPETWPESVASSLPET